MNNQVALDHARKLRDLSISWHMVYNYGKELRQAACIIEKLVEDKILLQDTQDCEVLIGG